VDALVPVDASRATPELAAALMRLQKGRRAHRIGRQSRNDRLTLIHAAALAALRIFFRLISYFWIDRWGARVVETPIPLNPTTYRSCGIAHNCRLGIEPRGGLKRAGGTRCRSLHIRSYAKS
jgi:hypothetical protein